MPTSSTACKGLCRAVVLIVFWLSGISQAVAKDCWSKIGERYGIDPLLLVAIAKVESSFNPKAIRYNRNGTYDVGLMQINSSNFSRLAAAGINTEKLDDACTSIEAGAVILSAFIEQHGYTWTAVGAYNAGSSPARGRLRKRYATKVWNTYRSLTQDDAGSVQLLKKWRRQQ